MIRLRKRKKEYQYIVNFKVQGEINRVSLKELAFRVSINDGIKAILCRKLTNDKVALFTYTFDKASKVLPDGTFIRHYIVMDVIYSIVKGIKEFLIFDHIHDILEYSDSIPEKIYNETKIFGINYLPDHLLDKVAEKILEKEEIEAS